jgi:DNA-binding SARP family transcriptional activator
MLLGPFEVGGPTGPIALGATKERLLLALLALRANEVVPTAQLIDALWGQHPPATAVKTVQGHIARVRRILESAGMAEVLITREPGYFLRVEPERVDATTFEERAEAGRRALAAGDAQTAERSLGLALGLWRGDALSDCRRESEAIEAAAVRLDELRLNAIEDHVDARLATGHHAAVIGDLEELVVRHPLRERLWTSLMMALYLSQRQADALRAYQRARNALVETLGIEPSSQLRGVETAILRGDATLDLLVPTAETSAAASAASESARPGSLTTSGPAFIGRDREVGQMTRAWDSALDGERGCVLLAGEAGIGKTRLAAEFARMSQPEVVRVLYGRCDEGLGVPYQPFVEALRMYVQTASDLDLRRGLGRYRNELVRLLPELPDRTTGLAPPLQSDAATEQYRLFEAVLGWLDAAADTTPVLLILDDLHWAASPTVLMLRHILRSDGGARLLVVGTYRDSELEDTHPLAAMLAESRVSVPIRGLQLLPLAGLDVEAIEAFVEAAAGFQLGDAGRRFARTLHAETGGNPFFVNETVRSLMESGAIAGPDAGGPAATYWPDDVRVPATVRDVVLRRFARLTDDAQHTLTLASVMGPDCDVRVLEEVVDLDEDPMLRALEDATLAGLLDETTADRFTFSHAIIRSALYDRLSVSRRVRLHTRVADAVERVYADALGDHVSELAYHYADADPDKAVSYAIRAATAALDRLAFEDAVNIARRGVAAVERARALRRPVSAQAEFDLLLALGRAELRCGQPGRHTLFRACEIAEELGDGLRQAQSLLPLNRGFFPRVGRIDSEFIDALERAIESQPPGETRQLAQLLAALASELVWAPDGERRFQLSDRAVAIARRVGDIRTLARVLLLRSMTILALDTLEERLNILEEVRGIADELDDPAIRFDNAFAHGSTGWEAGQIDQLNEMQEMASALATELRQPRLEWQASSMETARRILEGDLEQAEEYAQRTLELGHRAGQHTEAFIFFSEQMLEIRRWQDRGDEVAEFKAVAGDGAIDVGFTLARQLYDAGEHDVARAAYARIMQDFVLPPRRDPLAATRLHSTAYLASRFRDEKRARGIYDALYPYADLFTSTTIARPIGSHFLGMLAATFGRLDIASAHLRRAIEAHERVRAPLFLAESKLELAWVLLRSDARSSEAASLLGDTRATATAHRAEILLRGCDDVERVEPPLAGR